MNHFLNEMCPQGIMVFAFISLDWIFATLMNITTMIPYGHISQRELAIPERSVCLRGKIETTLGTSRSCRFHFGPNSVLYRSEFCMCIHSYAHETFASSLLVYFFYFFSFYLLLLISGKALIVSLLQESKR